MRGALAQEYSTRRLRRRSPETLKKKKKVKLGKLSAPKKPEKKLIVLLLSIPSRQT